MSRRFAVEWLLSAVVAAAASTSWPLVAQTPSPFTEEALTRGVDFTMTAYPQAQGYVGQGAGFVDLDSDGDPDIVVIGRADGKVGIFENIGGGYFVDHTLTSGIPTMVEQEGFASADYDADGLPDLYVTQAINRPNYLLLNNGSFTFTDVTASTGTNNGFQNSTGPSWGDYNNDGWPDLYVSNYGQANALYRNNGTGTFSNVALVTGVSGGTALSFQTAWTDFDRDGDSDLYLSNDRAPLGFPANFLWRNDGGTFVNVSSSGAGVSIYSMGVGAGDVDNNGYPDLYCTNINSWDNDGSALPYDGINPLLLNQGNGTFVEDAESWGVDNRTSSWAAIFFDWDNDGNEDLYVNNQFDPNSFFHCTGGPVCTEMAEDAGIRASFDPVYALPDDPAEFVSYSSAVADVDGDGDLDLLVNNLGYRAELFINQEGQKRNWVRYDVVGVHPNVFAVGASALTTVGGTTRFHENHAGGNGYLGQNELILHVGLDEADEVDQVVFRWPGNGPTRTLTGLPGGNSWKIYPPGRLCDADGSGVDHADFEAFADCFLSGFTGGCEMMDFDGDSSIYTDDLESCFVAAPQDCNGNGTEDLAEIMLDLGLDADENDVIDCCEAGAAKEPDTVGNTVLGSRSVFGEAVFNWTSPAVGGDHDPATSYDVFRSTTSAAESYGLLANTLTTSVTDADTAPDVGFYLISARNACGSSGEEPF